MEAIETMRPLRFFIMPRRAARARRKGAVRSTSSTAFQSASPMRRASMSRVKPALLTRMSRPPASVSIFSTSAAGAAGSVRSAGAMITRAPPSRLGHAGEFGLAPAGDGDGGTLGVQRLGDGLADAARGAGDERGLAGQVKHFSISW